MKQNDKTKIYMKQNDKTKIYIASNFGGGVRKSTTMAYLYLTLISLGREPLLVALDTNDTLKDLLLKGTPLITWDINNEDQSHQNLAAILAEAYKEQKDVVIDVAALGGGSLGIHTLLDTQMFELCELIAIVPILPTAKSIIEAQNAIKVIKPDKLVLIKYDTKRNSAIYDRLPEFKNLLKHKPDLIISPPELTDGNAGALRDCGYCLTHMEEACANNPIGHIGLRVFTKFWDNIRGQFEQISKL